MVKVGKRMTAARKGVDRVAVYDLDAAVKLLKENAKAKFDETIELSMNLGIDPRHSDQMVRGVVSLPKGTGKAVRVAVFAKGDKADEAKAAGADVVGADDQCDVSLWKGGIDVVHLAELVVVDVGFCEKHVHMPRHATRHWVDGEFHLCAPCFEEGGEISDLMLRLGYRHPVARHDDDTSGAIEQHGDLFR